MSKKHNSGLYYAKLAEKHGLKTVMGKGDHIKIIGPADRGYMVVPMHRELSNGTEYVVKKWFKALGIIVVIIGLFLLISCM